MHYVAIDPSPIHTAIVDQILHPDFEPTVGAKTLSIMKVTAYINSLVSGPGDWQLPLVVVIERPPQTPRGATIQSQQTIAAYWMIVWHIQERWPEAKIVSFAPGSWKPAAKGWGIEYPSTVADQHQRDAYAMLQVHLATKGKS